MMEPLKENALRRTNQENNQVLKTNVLKAYVILNVDLNYLNQCQSDRNIKIDFF